MRILRIVAVMLTLLSPLFSACRQGERTGHGGKINVATTLFPLYDFTRAVGGDRVDVRLLLPPGVEPHNFEPRPEEVARLSRADIFVFTNRYMEPWAEGLLKGIGNRNLTVVDASRGVQFLPVMPDEEPDGGHDHKHHEEGMDPHVWLSIPNAERMVENIRDALMARDPAGAEYYRANASEYLKKLEELDRKFREGLSNCSSRFFLHGGHYAFGYLAKRYGLTYVSAYAVSADAEPTPKKLMELVGLIRKNNVHAIFYEELLSPRVAETVAQETGAKLLKLNGIHNVSREELSLGLTYVSLMEENLKNLRTGLQCR